MSVGNVRFGSLATEPSGPKVEGVAIAGDTDSLQEAKDAFKRSFERLIEAGAVVLPEASSENG